MSSRQPAAVRSVELGAGVENARQPDAAKWLEAGRRKWTVATVATGLLVVGWLTLPAARPNATPTQSEERVAPLLEAELARRQTPPDNEPLQEVAERVMRYTVVVQPPATRVPRTLSESTAPMAPMARTGAGVTMTPDGLILSHADAVATSLRATVRRSESVTVDVEVVAYEAASGLVLLAARAGADWSVPPVAAVRPSPGAPMLAAAGGSTTPLMAPVVLAAIDDEHYRVIGAAGLPPGVPVFNRDGELLALHGAAGVAHDAAAAFRRLKALRDAGGGHHGVSGLVLQATNGWLSPWFGVNGVIVTDRLEPGPAARAGIRVGDVLLTIGDQAIESPGHLHFLIGQAAPGRAVTLSGRRAGREIIWRLVPQTAFELREVGLRHTWPEQVAQLRDVLPANWTGTVVSDAGGASVPPEAFVLTAANHPVGSAGDVRRRLQRARQGVLLYLDDGGERFFAVAREAAHE